MNHIKVVTVLLRGIRLRCPQCGIGTLYSKWNTLVEKCPHCGSAIERHGGDTRFFTYMSTAFPTGLIVLWMFLFPLTNYLLGQTIILPAWFSGIVLTLPHRKGIAVAVDYLIDLSADEQKRMMI